MNFADLEVKLLLCIATCKQSPVNLMVLSIIKCQNGNSAFVQSQMLILQSKGWFHITANHLSSSLSQSAFVLLM